MTSKTAHDFSRETRQMPQVFNTMRLEMNAPRITLARTPSLRFRSTHSASRIAHGFERCTLALALVTPWRYASLQSFRSSSVPGANFLRELVTASMYGPP
jgi:hypothetical protein